MSSRTSWRSRLWSRERSAQKRRLAQRRRFRTATVELLEQRHLLAAVAWDGGGDGSDWMDPKNWSSDSVPKSDDDVTISANVGSFVELDADTAIGSLTLSRHLRVMWGHSIDVAGASSIEAGGQLDLYGATVRGLGSLVNRGLVDERGSTRITIPFENRGTVRLSSGELYLDGGTFNNSGLVSITNVGSTSACPSAEIVVSNGRLINAAGGRVEATVGDRCGARSVDAEIENYGSIRAIDTTLYVDAADATHENYGAFEAVGGSIQISGSGDVSFEHRGRILIDSRQEIVTFDVDFESTGSFTGPGKLRMNHSELILPQDLDLTGIVLQLENWSRVSGAGRLINHSWVESFVGTNSFDVPFDNFGTLVLNAGTGEFNNAFQNHVGGFIKMNVVNGPTDQVGHLDVAQGFENHGTIELRFNGGAGSLTVRNGPLVNHGLIKTTGAGHQYYAVIGAEINAELDNRGEILVSSQLRLSRTGANHKKLGNHSAGDRWD